MNDKIMPDLPKFRIGSSGRGGHYSRRWGLTARDPVPFIVPFDCTCTVRTSTQAFPPISFKQHGAFTVSVFVFRNIFSHHPGPCETRGSD